MSSGAPEEVYKTLDDFIQTDSCQEALDDLMPEIVTENIERIKALLPDLQKQLLHRLSTEIVAALVGKTVSHPAIPDDNNEATVLTVGGPEQTEFDFANIEYYGDGELGINFTTHVDCTLNYAIYKGDYFTLPDVEDISIDECNEHYFDAEQDYSLTAEGVLSIIIDTQELESDQFADDDLAALINDANYSTDIVNTEVNVPYW